MGEYRYGIEWRILLALCIILAAVAVAVAGDFVRALPEYARAIAEVLAVFRNL